MHYLVGHDRSLMILLLVAFILRVGRTMTLEKRDVDTGGDGPSPDAFNSLTRDTVNTLKKVSWDVARFLLSAGESVNFVWDVALNALLSLVKTGGAAYGAIADRVADVPVIGYVAGGVGEAVKTTVGAVESNARHDVETRKRAFAELNAKLNESGARLSGRGVVVFPTN